MEIHLTSEQQAFIETRVNAGDFATPDAAVQAAVALLEHASTGADLIAALQSSPYREIDLEPESFFLPVRDVTF